MGWRLWMQVLPVLLVLGGMLALQGLGSEWPPARRFLWQRGIDLVLLALYLREFARHSPSFLEGAGLFVIAGGLLFLAYKTALIQAGMILCLSVIWLALTWIARLWPLRRGLLTLALFLSLLQAVISLHQAMQAEPIFSPTLTILPLIIMGVLAMVLVSSVAGQHGPRLSPAQLMRERLWADALVLVLFSQGVLGAALRHGGGEFLRGFHLLWGGVAVLLALTVGWRGRGWLLALPGRRWLGPALVVMPVNQLALGIYQKMGGSAPWLQPLHTMNGLAIYGIACLVSASLWLSRGEEMKTAPA
jgi:hypothetical protein